MLRPHTEDFDAMTRWIAFGLFTLCGACSDGGSADGGAGSSGTGGTTGTAGTAGTGGSAAGTGPTALEGECPTGFSPQEGMNTGFLSDDTERQFHVALPADTSSPRPVFLALTGTVQPELGFTEQSQLDQLPEKGWIVVTPWRSCSQEMRNCNGLGTTGSNDGRIWEPWYDGELERSDDPGPDARFVESAIRCIGTEWPVDADRIYVGGISAGGSFTNRLLTHRSEFYAGGIPASGNWYEGRAAPASEPEMDPSIVIVIWGGPDDKWPPPPNSFADYDPETKAASIYYAAQQDVVTLSCSGTHGHIWPTAYTEWATDTLLTHPKGTPVGDFELTMPPAGLSCVLGEYTDH